MPYAVAKDANNVHRTLSKEIRKAVGDKLKGQSSYTWEWDDEDPAFSHFHTTVEVDWLVPSPSGACVGFWKLRGPVTDDRPVGKDLSGQGNDVPQDQPRPSTTAEPDDLDTVLPFHVQSQEGHVNWCWAAVSASVSNFYRPLAELTSGTPKNDGLTTKEAVVEDQAHGLDWPLWSDHLAQPLAASKTWENERNRCDYTNLGAQVLSSLSVYSRWTDGVEMDAARTDLGEGRPVVMRIEWKKDRAGHFLVLAGVFEDPDSPHRDRTTLAVCDPFWGVSAIRYSAFARTYQGGGCVWSNTLHTWPHWIDD